MIEGLNTDIEQTLEALQSEGQDDSAYWLRLAKNAFETSTDYLDSNIRRNWELCIAHQNSEHAGDTKYASPEYKGRSKTFRPKTRINNLSAEAALAKALFSTDDLIDTRPQNPNDPIQEASAEIQKWLLEYRLRHSVKWYQTCVGAYQDARVIGSCISYQNWQYTLSPEGYVIDDKPVIDLVPSENVRFEPNADWRDPINTAAYVIRMVPMYANEVVKMSAERGWYEYDLGEIATTGRDRGQHDDTTRRTRQGTGRTDPAAQETGESNEFTLVWLHENFIRVDGTDMVFWTIGTDKLLSDPVPVMAEYPHLKPGERPLVMGSLLIEAHRNHPSSPTKIIAPLQKDANEIVNQRIDNVRLAMNKRYIIRRGATGIDVAALARSVPGGSVFADNPDTDIRELSYSDVTGSSYQEQDRIDLSIDEASGVFSQQTVSNNRNLNETVGGMSMMLSGASDVQEFMIRNFIETWVQPVLSQLVRLEAYYETDMTLLSLAAQQSEHFLQFGQGAQMDQLLRNDLVVQVNAGFGAVNPQQKIERLMVATNAISHLPTATMRLNEEAVIKEAFGAMGYRDGSRFFKDEEEFQQMMAAQQQGPDPLKEQELMLKQAELQADQERWQAEMEFKREQWLMELEVKREIELAKLAEQSGLKMQELESRLGIDMERLKTTRQTEAGRQALEQAKLALKSENLRQGYDTFG